MSDEWTVERIQELSGNNKPFRSLPERLREQGESNLAAENERLRRELAGSQEALAHVQRENAELRERYEAARKVAEAADGYDQCRYNYRKLQKAVEAWREAVKENPPPLESRLAAALDSFGEKESKADGLIREALMEEVMSEGRDAEC